MTHPIVTEEIVKRAVQAYDLARRPRTATAQWYPLHAALEAVAGDIAKRVGEEIAQAIEAGCFHHVADCDGTPCAGARYQYARTAREIGAGNGE